MQFLCQNHRDHVLHCPDVARQYWQQWLNQGTDLAQQDRWSDALVFLGSAYEVADWLQREHLSLDHSQLPEMDHYMLSGHLLAECYGRCQDRPLEQHCLLTVHAELLCYVKFRRPRHGLLRSHLQISLAMINRFCQQYGAFRGYYPLCRETDHYLNLCTH